MVKRRFSTVFAAGLIFVALLLVILLQQTRFGRLGLQPATGQSAAATPQQIYLPAVQQNQSQPTASPTELPTTDGMSLPPGWRDTDPDHPNDPNATAIPDEMPTSVPYIPAPTPDVNVTTVPELDTIVFTNFRELPIPSAFPSFFNLVAWSPDSKLFIGGHSGHMDGVDEQNLYIGNVETGEFSLWLKNGVFPTWSQDGQSVYYLAPRQDGSKLTISENVSRPYLDLFRRFIGQETSELVLKDVEPPGVPVPQFVEIASGEILKYDTVHQLSLLTTATGLVQASTQGSTVEPLFSFNTLLGELTGDLAFGPLSPSFSVSRDGRQAVYIVNDRSSFLLDLSQREIIGQFSNLRTAVNVAWSPDNSSLAYANRQGVFTYDLTTQTTQPLVMSQALGFHADDPWSGVALPKWIFDGQVVLFEALSRDWVKSDTVGRVETFVIAATKDGGHWRAIGNYTLESVSPDGRYAIVRYKDANTSKIKLSLVNIQR